MTTTSNFWKSLTCKNNFPVESLTMKNLLFFLLSALLFTSPSFAGNIRYGYNSRGEYVPTEIDGQNVDYGYNSRGEYVPTSIGGKKIDYGYNSRGEYVPTSVGDRRIDYGYNSRGQYVPTSVGGF